MHKHFTYHSTLHNLTVEAISINQSRMSQYLCLPYCGCTCDV